MAIVVLVLWLLTAGAGFYLLATSSLGRARAAEPAAAAAPSPASRSAHASPRASRDRFETPSLAAARQAPMMPGARSLLEFAHPACALIGLACWLGFTLIHDRALGWIAFALIAITACVGLAWFTVNVRVARRGDGDGLPPSFAGRLVVLHGCAAAVTIMLAALTALVARG